jgi:CDP-diacylglycerol--serine O-phosphatidyltransferase
MNERKHMIPFLPTALTVGNLICGFVATAKVVDALTESSRLGGPLQPGFSDKITQACWFILAAMLFDALDGRVARLMKQTSAFGTQLDSLADMLSFGLAPAMLAKIAYEHTMTQLELPFRPALVTALCSLYLIGAGLRLARFTVATDEEEASHDTFLGLPSPAAAFFLVAFCFFVFDGRHELWLDANTADSMGIIMLRGLPGIAAALGLLMISRVRYVHIMQRYIKPRTRVGNFVRLFLVLWIIVLFREWVFLLAAVGYVFGGLFVWMRRRAKEKSLLHALPTPWDADDDEAFRP